MHSNHPIVIFADTFCFDTSASESTNVVRLSKHRWSYFLMCRFGLSHDYHGASQSKCLVCGLAELFFQYAIEAGCMVGMTPVNTASLLKSVRALIPASDACSVSLAAFCPWQIARLCGQHEFICFLNFVLRLSYYLPYCFGDLIGCKAGPRHGRCLLIGKFSRPRCVQGHSRS